MSNIEDAMDKLEKQRKDAGEESGVTRQKGETPAEGTPYVATARGGGHVDERIVSYHKPNSVMAENFKQFHSMIRNLSQESSATLAFTSSIHGEGRTTAAVNFAVALASDVQGQVCLVDADLRRPGVHKALDIRASAGLTDLLSTDNLPVANVAVATSVPRLSVVCAGNVSKSPSELLRSPRLAKVMGDLREQFDYIVFDTAPLLPVADTIHLAGVVDGVIMLVESGRTKRDQVKRALELISHASVMGFVLNRAPEKPVAGD